MKTRVYWITAAATVATLACYGYAPTPEGVAGDSVKPALEVHEWGTFTSMQGTAGHSLEGMHHEEEALPRFVHRVVETPISDTQQGKGGISATRVIQKMETPVIYFYSDEALKAEVNVGYSGGIMSEWFPAATHYVDGTHAQGKDVLDVSKVDSSRLRWQVDIAPKGTPVTGVPDVVATDPWSFAREVGASMVTDRNTGESEHYLFYRGLGSMTLDVTVEQEPSGDLRVKNGMGARIPAAFVLEVEPKGARFTRVGGINLTREVAIGQVAFADAKSVADELKQQVEEALVETGLFRDESAAMVKTWSRSWFESEGSRVIYIVPRQVVDSMLPLTISPQPDITVRTLVGRLEYVKPGVMREVATAVRNRTARDPAKRRASKVRIARLGRYVEPHLRLLLSAEKDQRTRRNAKKMLEELCP